ncbi:site-specific integrase [Nocardioides okcheonensis]|uniref:site-specific integrase n=1 Tax=Nocardioides okcheonensis TaxID=2894081 RepID=UPI001E288332|nr:site-specific integrase [Nocardioides okcheonensis]UFN43190.1 site-specific integrase [Nocardioides okcheonensis]
MIRVQVIQGGAWDAEVIQDDLGVQPLDLRPVLSPVMFVDGRIEPDATRWLAETHSRTDGTETAQSYGDSLSVWVAHLLRHNSNLRGATRDHLIEYVRVRTVDPDTRVSGNTWKRDRTAIKQFHTWLRETHGVAVPFTLTIVQTPRGPVESMREGRGVPSSAASGTPLTPSQIPDLLAAAWRMSPDGTLGDTLTAGRDAAFIGLGLACGARLNALAHLTVWELPDPSQPGDLIEMRLPGAIIKGRREVRLPAFRNHLQHVWSYAHPTSGSRRLLLKDWRPKDPIQVAEVHTKSGGFWGITDDRGRRYAFNDLKPEERRRLVTPDGHPALLFLNAYTGKPLSLDTLQELTGDISLIAEANADANESSFPHVHTHDLRHTYATHLAAAFMLGVPTSGARDMHGQPHRVDVNNAIQMACVGLGHLDEGTTALYIQQVGLMLTRYTLADFLGRS